MSKTFSSNLKQLMKSRNLSAGELSKAIDIPSKTIQEWLNDRMPRNPEAIKKIANYFNCSTHFVLFGEEDPKSMLSDLLNKTEIHSGLYQITISKVIEKK